MAVTSNTFTGDGSTTNYSFTFEYLEQDEVKVTLDGTATTAFTFANATTLSFTSAPANGVEIRIYRDTDIDTLKATFFPGSAIKAEDLNNNFTQNNFAVQEIKANTWDSDSETIKSNETWVSSDSQIATTAAMDARFQDEVTETIESTETWVSDDDRVPTTLATDNRVDSKIDTAITGDIGTDGTGITVTDDGDGTITLGLAANTIDLDRIKDEDIVTYAEQNAGSPSWDSDSRIPTTYAAAKRFDTLVQVATPTGTDWEVGKTWLQNDADKTVSIWNGSAWVAIASGGSFTELTKVIYVDSVNGDDTLAGHRISNPKRTIKAAIDDINADSNGDGSIVLVAPGIYGEEFPIDIQKNDVAIVGQSLRNCIIHPAIPAADQAGYDVDVPEANELQTMFRVNSGSYFYGLTLQGMKASGTRGGNALDTDATYGLPTNQGWNFAFYPGATIKKSPYIQNCTNFSDSQINNVTFTPHTPGEGAAGDLDSAPSGGGILIDGNTPSSSSPLRSMVCDSYTHTALNGPGIFVTNNGYCQATSSYSFFNHYHLKTKNGGQANLAASTTDFGTYSLIADGRSTAAIFTATTTASANDGDITFTIGTPVVGSPWHGSATRPQDNMLVDVNGITYPVLSATANGSGWDVTISRPDPNDRSSNLGLNGAVGSGAAVEFYLRSMVASSGHTMEYVGSGTDYTALPENGGVPDDTKQTIELNNGKIWAAITDHRGTFKVGDTFEVNQQTGFVTIDSTASDAVTKTSPTGSAIIPNGTTAQRDASPSNGYFRYNTTNNAFEGYVGGVWSGVGGVSDGDKGDITVSASGATWTIDNDTIGLDELSATGTPSASTYLRGDNTWAAAVVTDGDKGDITVSGSGATWTIDNDTIGLDELSATGTPSATTYLRGDNTWATTGTVTNVATGTGLTGGPITSTGTISLDNTAVTAGSYTAADITVDAQGRITAAASGTISTAEIEDDAVTAAKLADTAVTAGSYTTADITVDAQGRITAASSGSGTSGTSTVATGNLKSNLNNELTSRTTGNYNVALGQDALDALTTAADNVGIGRDALGTVTTGGRNVGIGYDAGGALTEGIWNVFVGYDCGSQLSTNSKYNTLVGANVKSGTTGNQDYLTIVGYGAGENISSAHSNTLFGAGAGGNITTGIANVLAGRLAGSSITTGTYNVCSGYSAGDSTTTASNTVSIGRAATCGNGTSGVMIGYNAGNSNLTGSVNVGIGNSSAGDLTSGTQNTCIGSSSGSGTSTAAQTTAVGYNATAGNGNYNTFLGASSGDNNATGDSNVGVGWQTGSSLTTGSANVFVGHNAGNSMTTGYYTVVIGRNAGGSITTGYGNNLIGESAGISMTTGHSNVTLGRDSGFALTTGTHNTCLGNSAGGVTGPTTATGITIVGAAANSGNGNYNTFVGYGTGGSSVTGANNTALGYLSGGLTTTGTNNTSLGNGANPSANTASNEVTLGNSSITSLRCNVTSISSLSDGRDKTEVEDLPLGLDFINTLRPVKFKWETRDGNIKDGSYDAGFIAQDLQSAQSASDAEYLSMVMDTNPDRLEASYGRLIPVLVQAIKDLKTEIDTLKANA